MQLGERACICVWVSDGIDSSRATVDPKKDERTRISRNELAIFFDIFGLNGALGQHISLFCAHKRSLPCITWNFAQTFLCRRCSTVFDFCHPSAIDQRPAATRTHTHTAFYCSIWHSEYITHARTHILVRVDHDTSK